MRNSLLSGMALAVVASALVPNKFTSGRPVISQDVNDNFTYLDTTVAKKADVSVKTDLDATKSDLKALQAKQKADSATLAASAANGLSMATVNTSLAGLRDTVSKKKDSAWILKAVTPSAIGALPASGGTANSLAKWNDAATLGASGVKDDGTAISFARPISGGITSTGQVNVMAPWSDLYGQLTVGAKDQAGYLSFRRGNDGSNTARIGFQASATESNELRYTAAGGGAFQTWWTNNSSGVLAERMRLTKDGLLQAEYGLSVTGNTSLQSATVSGDLVAGSLASNAGVGGKSVGLNKGASDVVGNGSFIQFNDSLSKTQQAWIVQLGASNTLDFWNYANGFWTGNKPVIQFLPTGALKTVSLDVGGDIRVAGSLKTTPGSVKSSDVADYVFEPSYKLASLPEVEAFAMEHKHLPEVPSATEIERGGMDLAQMNLVLLKKVEELTLHAIEQQKAIEQQRQEMAQVKAELKSLKRD